MKFSDFLKSEKTIYVHCKNENQANKLCEAFIENGKTWKSNDSYIDTFYDVFKGRTCYSNKGTFTSFSDKKYGDMQIIEFDDLKEI